MTALFTSLDQDLQLEEANQQIAALIDVWLLVASTRDNGERNRSLSVLKARGMAHSNQIREFLLTSLGLEWRSSTGSARCSPAPPASRRRCAGTGSRRSARLHGGLPQRRGRSGGPQMSSGAAPEIDLELGENETCTLRLYVADASPKSLQALANLKRLCEEQLRIALRDRGDRPPGAPRSLAAGDEIIAIPDPRTPAARCRCARSSATSRTPERVIVGLQLAAEGL